jgi:hypothetical protein
MDYSLQEQSQYGIDFRARQSSHWLLPTRPATIECSCSYTAIAAKIARIPVPEQKWHYRFFVDTSSLLALYG